MAEGASRSLDQYIVRFPDGMRPRIKAAADANARSMNAEIVAALQSHFALQDKHALGWRWVPPEQQIPDAIRASIRDAAARRGVSYGTELTTALSGYLLDRGQSHDSATRERLLRLVSEFVDIVKSDEDEQQRAEPDAADEAESDAAEPDAAETDAPAIGPSQSVDISPRS